MSSDIAKQKELVEKFLLTEAQKNLAEYKAKSQLNESNEICEVCHEKECICDVESCEKCNESACICEDVSYEVDLVHKLNDIVTEIHVHGPKPLPIKDVKAAEHILLAIKALKA